MSDLHFRKAINKKMTSDSTLPEDFVWENLEKKLAAKRAEKRKKRRIILFLLLPFLATTCFFLFDKKELSDSNREPTLTAQNRNKPQITLEEKVLTTRNLPLSSKAKTQAPAVDNLSDKNKLNGSTHHNTPQTVFHKSKSQQKIKTGSTRQGQKIKSFSKKEPNKTQLIIQSNSDKHVLFSEFKSAFIPAVPKIEILKSFLVLDTQMNLSDLPFTPKSNESKKHFSKKKIMLGASFGYNNLAYCFDETAKHFSGKIESEYRFSRLFAVGLGLGFHQTNYEFDVDKSVHLEAFGNTDKYPDFYKFKRAVEAISSDLQNFTGTVSGVFYYPVSEKWTTSVTISQDFIFTQKQQINYNFFNNKEDIRITNRSSGADVGLTGFKLGIHRSFGDNFTAGIYLNRYITTQTIGMERQYYHGFGGSTRFGYLF